MTHRTIAAASLKPGMWIAYNNPRMNERVMEVAHTRDGAVKVYHDFGGGGEPAISFYEPGDLVCVA